MKAVSGLEKSACYAIISLIDMGWSLEKYLKEQDATELRLQW